MLQNAGYKVISTDIIDEFLNEQKNDIEELRKNLFEIEEYHNEGGNEQKNWHVLTLRKIK